MDALISKLQKRKSTLSNLENQVLEYILANPKEVSESTIEQLAETLFISTATISRTAKHLGFKGFQELKYAILNYYDVERGEQNTTKLAKEATVFGGNISKQIEKSFESLSESQVDEIVSILLQTNTIEVVGVGGSLPACIDVSKKLMALGKKATARTDWDELRAISKSLNKNDLAILVSLSGETIHIIEYATNYMERGVPIIAVVGVSDSTLEKIATYTLKAFVEPVYFQDVDLSSRAALNSILDFILIRMAEEKK
ncbi:MurR/RpiR family transcriptional regulator [Marinilactibacillus sp. XAAS-LB27]|uniref:MurR/RpiR family transcriptional regulator n=1 Tax=Marinilactibacillus sp. XAAS-LB27 TaxID=3114538 RepID=UPI002E1809D7|nr:MurR/RpiR family transcriptional regulator [Marinilactibacillus sp. XAAS-LB27]